MRKKTSRTGADNQPQNSRNPAAHLARHKWKAGQSGNAAGRPKREVPSETLRAMLGAEYDGEAVKQLQKTMPEPWRSRPEVTAQEIFA